MRIAPHRSFAFICGWCADRKRHSRSLVTVMMLRQQPATQRGQICVNLHKSKKEKWQKMNKCVNFLLFFKFFRQKNREFWAKN